MPRLGGDAEDSDDGYSKPACQGELSWQRPDMPEQDSESESDHSESDHEQGSTFLDLLQAVADEHAREVAALRRQCDRRDAELANGSFAEQLSNGSGTSTVVVPGGATKELSNGSAPGPGAHPQPSANGVSSPVVPPSEEDLPKDEASSLTDIARPAPPDDVPPSMPLVPAGLMRPSIAPNGNRASICALPGGVLDVEPPRSGTNSETAAQLALAGDTLGMPTPELPEVRKRSVTYDPALRCNSYYDIGQCPTMPEEMTSQADMELRKPQEGEEVLLRVTIQSATGLRSADYGGTSDPYCVCRVIGESNVEFHTSVVDKTLDPEWNYEKVISNFNVGDDLHFEVFDKDWGSKDDPLGNVLLEGKRFFPDGFEGCLQLEQAGKKHVAYINVVVKIAARSDVPVPLKDVWVKPCSRLSLSKKASGQTQRSHTSRSNMDGIWGKEKDRRFSGIRAVMRSFRPSRRSARCFRPGSSCPVLMPESTLRVGWDISGIFVLLIDLVLIPLQAFDPPQTDALKAFGWLTRLYWSIDMIMTMNTGIYTKSGKAITRRRMIMCNYVKSYMFYFDTLIVGIDWAMWIAETAGTDTTGAAGESSTAARAGKLARAARIIRLLRLMRLAKLRQLLFTIQGLISSEWLTIVFTVGRNLFTILAMNHCLACLWFAVGNASSNGWVDKSGYDDESLALQYVLSLHWSLAQFTPGAAPVSPTNLGERTFNVLVLCWGLVVATCFVSSVTSTLNAVWAVNRYNGLQTFLLKRFLHQNAVDPTLGSRVTRYIECVVELRHKKIHKSKVDYLNLLSGPLNVELQCELYEPYLALHPFFDEYSQCSKVAMKDVCMLALEEITLAKADMLFRRARDAHHMFFLKTGTLVYKFKKEGAMTIQKLDAGQWCCEAVLWLTSWKHRGSMKAMSDCEVILMHGSKFSDVTSGIDEVYSLARESALDFARQVQGINSFDPNAFSDMPLGANDVIVQPPAGFDELKEAESAEAELFELIESDTDEELKITRQQTQPKQQQPQPKRKMRKSMVNRMKNAQRAAEETAPLNRP